MKKFYPTLISVLILFIFSCGGKEANKTQQELIVGKWNMQKQNIVVYIDDLKKAESALTASDTTKASVEFTKDGKYISISSYKFISGNFSNYKNDTINSAYRFLNGGQFEM